LREKLTTEFEDLKKSVRDLAEKIDKLERPALLLHEVCSSFRFEPGLENAPVIAVSGRSEDSTTAEALEAGCAEFHVKPIAPGRAVETATQSTVRTDRA
jgi:CheY-like chemotaxis protein